MQCVAKLSPKTYSQCRMLVALVSVVFFVLCGLDSSLFAAENEFFLGGQNAHNLRSPKQKKKGLTLARSLICVRCALIGGGGG